MSFQRVVSLDELWDGDLLGRRVEGHPVVLLRRGDDVYAYEDRCAHLGVPLSQGTVSGELLVCSAHHYEYDLRTGAGVRPANVCLTGYPVHIRDGAVWIDVAGRTR